MAKKTKKKELKSFTFDIWERATYQQRGTVTVEASNLKDAEKKLKKRDYSHHGDNEIDYNTESDTEVVDFKLMEESDE